MDNDSDNVDDDSDNVDNEEDEGPTVSLSDSFHIASHSLLVANYIPSSIFFMLRRTVGGQLEFNVQLRFWIDADIIRQYINPQQQGTGAIDVNINAELPVEEERLFTMLPPLRYNAIECIFNIIPTNNIPGKVFTLGSHALTRFLDTNGRIIRRVNPETRRIEHKFMAYCIYLWNG